MLLSHPDIAQAVAFGVPDDKYGEEVNYYYHLEKHHQDYCFVSSFLVNFSKCFSLAYPYKLQINCAVIPREESNIDEAEVLRFCKKNLAAFKVPKKVFITDALPKTATGKIQRRIVAEHFLAQISTAKVPKFGA